MEKIKRLLLHQNLLVFFFCLGVLAGPATSVLLNDDLQVRCTDCITYKGIANFDFNQKNGVRRYRIIIPMIAAGINNILDNKIDKTAPNYFYSDFSLAVSFFLVNIFLFCCYGVVIYRTCMAFGAGVIPSLGALLMVLCCRWTAYLAATPMIDSLYCLVTALLLYAIHTRNNRFVILCIFLGPFAKESFIFFLPLIFFYSGIPRWRLLLFFAISAAIMMAYRYVYEQLAGLPAHSGMQADWGQWTYFKRYWWGLFHPRELFKLFFSLGAWLLIPVYGLLFVRDFGKQLKGRLPGYVYFFLGVVGVHMLFGGYDRHFYLAMPAIAVVIAVSAHVILQRFPGFQQKINPGA